MTQIGIPSRSLVTQTTSAYDNTIKQIREALFKHHISPEMLKRDNRRVENLRQLGFRNNNSPYRIPRHSDKTKKGNLAEIFLAEYIVASSEGELPVYRLRYNPNVEQAMKGDDVLAFDFNSNPVRIFIGESKFRSTPSKAAVKEIIDGLLRSHQVGLPVSLQFVADRLFEENNTELAEKVENCALLIAQGNLEVSYVGFLMSDRNSHAHIERSTDILHKLVLISLGLDDPNLLVSNCYEGLEAEYGYPT